MNMQAEQKTLLKKFLNGTCNDRELQEVKTLLEQPFAKEFLQELMSAEAEQVEQEYFEKGEDLASKTEQWLSKVNQQINPKENPIPTIRLNAKTWAFPSNAAIWAGILMLSGLLFWQLRRSSPATDNIAYVEIINEIGVPERFMLPDSSVIYLGARSSLKYPEGFNGKMREVKLIGEAFFEVKHMPKRPFIVHTGEIQTQVLGTSFKVQAFETQPLMVSVATGKVGVSKVGELSPKLLAMLSPGAKLTYHTKTGQFVKAEIVVDDLLGWKNGDIVFEEQNLTSVMAELERRFGSKIIFADEQLKTYQVSGSFPANQSLETDLKMLSIIGKFKYQATPNNSFLIDKIQ